MNRYFKRNRGATLVEAAIALPVLLVIVFLVIEAFVYLARLGVFNYGVQEGATLASTIPGLRSQDTVTRDAALQAVRDRTWGYASLVLGDPSKFDQDASGNPVIVTVAASQVPVRVELRARYMPINPLLRIVGDIPVRAQALVFRDEGISANPPVELCENVADCPCGNGGSGVGRRFCDCPPPFTENEMGQCVCGNTCNPPQVQDPQTCACSCPGGQLECGQFQYWNPATCSCACDGWRLQVHCRSQNPPRGWDTNTCACTETCPTNTQGENCDDCINRTCLPPKVWNESWCTCECPPPHSCGSCQSYNSNACACQCAAPLTGTPPDCACPSNFCTGKVNRTVVTQTGCGCSCECPPPLEPTGPDSCGGGSG